VGDRKFSISLYSLWLRAVGRCFSPGDFRYIEEEGLLVGGFAQPEEIEREDLRVRVLAHWEEVERENFPVPQSAHWEEVERTDLSVGELSHWESVSRGDYELTWLRDGPLSQEWTDVTYS
jgi:hypothetical protein